jgi:hypothetical protein
MSATSSERRNTEAKAAVTVEISAYGERDEEDPPGVEAMKHLKDQITYTAEKTAKGAQVRIATRSPRCLLLFTSFCASRSKTTARVTR